LNAVRSCLNWLKSNWSWLRWLVAVTVLALLFRQHWSGIERLRGREIQWTLLLVGFALATSAIVITFVRWFLLVWALDIPFRIGDALRLGFIGFLFNYVAPGGAGGDLFKAVMIAREHPKRRAVAVSTIALDRMIGMLALFIVGATASMFPTRVVAQTPFRPIMIAYIVGGVGGLIGLAVMLHPAVPRSRWLNKLIHLKFVGHIIGELINALLMYQSRRRVLIAAVLLSVPGHLGILSSFYFCSRALFPAESVPNYVEHLQIVPAAELAGVLAFFMPGGVGALEEALAWFYTLADCAADDGFLAAIAFRGLTILIALIGVGYYFAARRDINKALDESAQEKVASSTSAIPETTSPPSE